MTDLLKFVRCPRCGALVEVYATGLKWNPSDAVLCEEKLIENCPHLKHAVEQARILQESDEHEATGAPNSRNLM
jgi:hypothetical protein